MPVQSSHSSGHDSLLGGVEARAKRWQLVIAIHDAVDVGDFLMAVMRAYWVARLGFFPN